MRGGLGASPAEDREHGAGHLSARTLAPGDSVGPVTRSLGPVTLYGRSGPPSQGRLAARADQPEKHTQHNTAQHTTQTHAQAEATSPPAHPTGAH